ncbi:MAG: hypothetical protein ACTS3T_02620 [Almyronema sp.]
MQVSRINSVQCKSWVNRDRPHQGLQTTQFKFHYRFGSEQWVQGTVRGQLLANLPNLAFNLHAVEAVYLDRANQVRLHFNQGFGQFHLDSPKVLFLGTNTVSGAFFSFNDRGSEASVFDGSHWIASGWEPSRWLLQEVPVNLRRSWRQRSVATSAASSPL